MLGQRVALLGAQARGGGLSRERAARAPAPTRAPGRAQVSYKSYWIRAILEVLHAGRGTMMSIQDVSNVTGIHPNDVREAMGTIQLTQCAPRAPPRLPSTLPPPGPSRSDGDSALRARAAALLMCIRRLAGAVIEVTACDSPAAAPRPTRRASKKRMCACVSRLRAGRGRRAGPRGAGT